MSTKENHANLVNECHELLLKNKNIILTGAPGTGKTYLAKEIAAKLMGLEYDESAESSLKDRIKMVQFHPSYDYTDFIEGLRPVLNSSTSDSQNISFERRDGHFKEFCKKALPDLPDLLDDNKITETLDKIRKIDFEVEGNKHSVTITDCQNTCKFSDVIKDFDNYTIYTKNIKELLYVTDQSEAISILKKLNVKEDLEYFATLYLTLCQKIKEYHSYVFIIDEINRGEISKIFGELLFSIDSEYRGKKGTVSTQYQNLIKDEDPFKEGFYVPKNVYIIATMNDIDRNVENIDFAFLRRFAKREIGYTDTIDMLDDLTEKKIADSAKNRLRNLNDAISKISGLSNEYNIGASYMLKVKYYDNDFEKLWNYHIQGVLKEYLREMDSDGTKFKELKDAYDTSNTSNNR